MSAGTPSVVNLDNKYAPIRTPGRDTIVFTIGKFNPPHVGHIDTLGRTVAETAAKYNADPVIFASDKTNKFDGRTGHGALTDLMNKIRSGRIKRPTGTSGEAVAAKANAFEYVNLKKENDTPLTPEFKLYLLREIYNTNKIIPWQNVLLGKGALRGAIPEISKAGYKNIILVVGSDRVEEFTGILELMAQNQIPPLTLEAVVMAGEEREEEGVSGTVLRQLANEAIDKSDPEEEEAAVSEFKELTQYPEITISDPKLLTKLELPEAMSLTTATMFQIRNRIPRGGKKRKKTKKGKNLKRKKTKKKNKTKRRGKRNRRVKTKRRSKSCCRS